MQNQRAEANADRSARSEARDNTRIASPPSEPSFCRSARIELRQVVAHDRG